MSAESLRAEIDFVLSNTDHSWEAGAATITDFLRQLHELMFKSGRDQAALLSQVQAVFGYTTTCHLARTLQASDCRERDYAMPDAAPLYERVALICNQRSFDLKDGLQMIAHFIKALDEERTDEHGNLESAAVMVYWSVGHEAAYHLGGLYVGDQHDMVATELGGYLDTRLKRFYKLVEIWQMELAWAREDSE